VLVPLVSPPVPLLPELDEAELVGGFDVTSSPQPAANAAMENAASAEHKRKGEPRGGFRMAVS
jgi:hypothetical protein